LDALFSAASNGQLKMIASTGRATGRNNAADGGDIPATDTAAEVAAMARRSATLAFAQRTVARLQSENDKLKAQVHALTSKLSDADTKLSDAGAQVSRQDALLAAAAEATARCEALERQLAAIQQEQQKRASEAPSLHATTEPAASGDTDERAAEGVVYFPPAAPSEVPQKPGRLTTSSSAAATTASAPASSGAGAAPRQTSHAAEMDLRRRLSALEAALAHARADCARLEDENAELRAELASLDPAFFDFVDQLKGKTQVQEDVLARYESLLRQYADALGLPFTREHVPDAILHI
jgi:chromosome segregation ATPase